MVGLKKALIVIGMVLTWLVTVGMVIPMKSVRGIIATVAIGLIINILLALYYSFLTQRPTSFREWLKM